MKHLIYIIIILFFSCLFAVGTEASCLAQNTNREKKGGFFSLFRGKTPIERATTTIPKPTPTESKKIGWYMNYEIQDGDTVYMDIIQPTWVFAKTRGKKSSDWRRYYRLVYNFSIVYPYSLVARKLVKEADNTIESSHFNRIQKEKYIKQMQNELFEAFEVPLKHMTISQGVLLVKLVNREVGRSTYLLIKDYKSGIAAIFWQGVARLFGNDLKADYDPAGADKAVESLVQKWDSGQFDALYYSIFYVYPPKPNIPSKYR